jgi:hypothetical protein
MVGVGVKYADYLQVTTLSSQFKKTSSPNSARASLQHVLHQENVPCGPIVTVSAQQEISTLVRIRLLTIPLDARHH